MLQSYFLQGYVLGFTVGTTIGVGGVVCLQNMMTGRLSLGLASALAAALADMSCGMIVVGGLQFLQETLMAYNGMISIIAGLFLCGLGLRKIFGSSVFVVEHGHSKYMLGAVATVYFLSILDPVSVGDFLAMCIGLTLDFSIIHNAYKFILGLFLGSATWWFSLCGVIMLLRYSVSVSVLYRIQQVVGFGILLLGFWIIGSAWHVVFGMLL